MIDLICGYFRSQEEENWPPWTPSFTEAVDRFFASGSSVGPYHGRRSLPADKIQVTIAEQLQLPSDEESPLSSCARNLAPPQSPNDAGLPRRSCTAWSMSTIKTTPNTAAVFHTNASLTFVEPTAISTQVVNLVRERLQSEVTVVSEGFIPSEAIDEFNLVDAHFGIVASKAIKISPRLLELDTDVKARFKQVFGVPWDRAIENNIVYNSQEAMSHFKLSVDDLLQRWEKLEQGGNLLVFSDDFHVGKLSDKCYVVNAFYLGIRKAFTAPGQGLHYFEIEWPSSVMSWFDFDVKVLGDHDTDGSLRQRIHRDWAELGLSEQPDVDGCGLHGSRSPLEAFTERANWLGCTISSDPFAKALVASGVTLEQIEMWFDDPVVSYKGQQKAIFEICDNMDPKACVGILRSIPAPPETPENDADLAVGFFKYMEEKRRMSTAVAGGNRNLCEISNG